MNGEQNNIGENNRGQTVIDFLTAFTLLIILFSLVITYTFTFLPISSISDESPTERQAITLADELTERTFTTTDSTSSHTSPVCTAAFFTEQDEALGCQAMNGTISEITGVSIQQQTEVRIETTNGNIATVGDIITSEESVIVADGTEELTRGDSVQNVRIQIDRPIAINGETYKLVVRVQ